jgi:hypothetical protein
MGIDQRRHYGFAGKIDTRGPVGCDLTFLSDLHEFAIPHQQRRILNRSSRLSRYKPRAFKQNSVGLCGWTR